MQTLWQDLKFAVRILTKNRGFTAVAVLTLALGIGANTAIFSVVNTVLLQPLPYRDPGQIISLTQIDLKTHASGALMSYTKYTQIREQSKTLESMAGYYSLTLSLVTEREPEAANGARASIDLFRVLGISPARGRVFLPEEEQDGGPDVAVISDGFWHSHFAGDPAALGKALVLDGKSATIVGILPASFRFPLQFPEPDVWLPRPSEMILLTPAQVRGGASYFNMIARLRPRETLKHAQAELDAINASYKQQFGSNADATKFGIFAQTLEDSLVGGLRTSLLVLLTAVGFVLLIACANVANLLLARATAREREIAVRKALGASSGRLVRQLLSESILLSVCGGVLGVLLAIALLPSVRSISPGTVPRLAEAKVDAVVLAFSLLLCVFTGIVFGLVPALQTSKKDLHETLKEGGRGSSEGGSRGRFRAALVVAEICVALVLMTVAGLLMQSFSRLMHVNPGFSPENLMAFPMTLPPSRYSQPELQAQFYRQLLEHVKAMPEVRDAGITSYLPLGGGARYVFVCPEGRVCEGVGKDPTSAVRQVSAGYFETVRTPLLRGRTIDEKDIAGGSPVAVINETAAKHFFPGQNPVGRHIANSRDMVQREIVGVVADVKFNALSAANVEEMYLPMAQVPWPNTTLLVRSEANSQALVSAVRAKIAEIDPTLPVTGISSMEEVVGASIAQPKLTMQFVGIFAGFALLLAAIGIYGVMAYTATARKQEMGIRVALGARPTDILRLVVGQGMRMTLIGIAIGVAASLALTRLLAGLLFGVQATDPLVFSAAALVLAGAAFVACYIPARRATRVDPIIVLRYE
ncbi:MAG TPA: ABC transporter permease [Candidatus Acidoferrum sp.]|nr:ABC transporter permease [Candidatus Acidoferrum sp.]